MLPALIRSLLVVALVGSVMVAIAAPPAVRNVDLTYTCEVPALPAGAKAVDLWIPVLASNDRQSVRLLNQDQLHTGRFTTDKKFGNRIYYQRFEAPVAASAGGERPTDSGPASKIEFVYEVEVHEATVPAAKDLISTKQVVPGPDFAPYLEESKMIPIKGRIAELAGGIGLSEGEPLRAGRRIYDYLVDTMTYNYQAPGAGTGNAVWACDSKTGDCTDYHSVFIGACRWRGIPADHVFGLPIPPDKPDGDVKYCHCWARFWVADVGWIPIDASRADKFPGEREYYFGTIGSTWITIAHGRDVVLEPPQHGAPINMFEAPYAEIDGKPVAKVQWIAHYKDHPQTVENASATK